MRTTLALITVLVLTLAVPSAARQPSWTLTATVAESCSCTVSCPCNFGGEPSHMPCEGNRMISIDQGHYGDVDLAGVQLLVTFNMRNWSKIYVSDKVSDRQMQAVEALLPLAFAGFHRGMLSFTKAPITMEASETRVKFSGPESSVEMEVLKGFNGTAVKVLNLPSAVFQDYTQFTSLSHTHSSAAHAWNHQGTNGFTSKWEAGSTK
jgi:hypothetical protein